MMLDGSEELIEFNSIEIGITYYLITNFDDWSLSIVGVPENY